MLLRSSRLLLFKSHLISSICLVGTKSSSIKSSPLKTLLQFTRTFHQLSCLQDKSCSGREINLNKTFFRNLKLKSTNNTQLASQFKMEWPKITLFGDSITRFSMDSDNGCWGSLIAYEVGSYFDVDVRGFEGYNTRLACELLPQLFPKTYLEKVELFVSFFGHNDSWENSVLGVPVEEFEENTKTIIKYLLDNGLDTSKIIMITPSWYYDIDFKVYLKELGMPPSGKSLEHSKKYSEAVLRVAKDASLDVVDFYDKSKSYEPLQELFCDGVHFSRKGAKVLFSSLMPVIKKKIEASHKKPIADIWHVTPVLELPQVQEYMKTHLISLKKTIEE